MIVIHAEQCTGCGACLEACPTGAIFLVSGKAVVDAALCRECEACVAACPCAAISVIARQEAKAEATDLPALRPELGAIRVAMRSAPVPLRSRILPALGAALTWAWREVLPWLVDLLDSQATRSPVGDATRSRQTLTSGAKGSGSRYRHRRRGDS